MVDTALTALVLARPTLLDIEDYTTGMYDGVHFYGLAALRLIGSISSSNISISSSYDGDLRLVLLDSLHGSELILLAGTD